MLCILVFYLSTPFSLCLCFLDMSKPPPHAPCTGHSIFTTITSVAVAKQLALLVLKIVCFLLRPHGATCCTSHRYLRFHWWDQTLRRRWSRQWRSQTLEHNPAERQTWKKHSIKSKLRFVWCVSFATGQLHGSDSIPSCVEPWKEANEQADVWLIAADIHLLLGLYYFGFQISRDDSPSGQEESNSKPSTYPNSYQTAHVYVECKANLSSVFSRIRFSVPKPRAALAFLME